MGYNLYNMMDGVKLKILEKIDEMPESSYKIYKNFFTQYSIQHVNRLCRELFLEGLIKVKEKEQRKGRLPAIIYEITKKGIEKLENS
jgi:DNA-binding PadR family transcriptional regulator